MLTKIEFVCQNPCKWFSANRDICRFLVGGRNYRGPHFSQKEANCCPKRNRGAFCSLPRLSPFVFFSFSRLVFAHRSKGKIQKIRTKVKGQKSRKKSVGTFLKNYNVASASVECSTSLAEVDSANCVPGTEIPPAVFTLFWFSSPRSLDPADSGSAEWTEEKKLYITGELRMVPCPGVEISLRYNLPSEQFVEETESSTSLPVPVLNWNKRLSKLLESDSIRSKHTIWSLWLGFLCKNQNFLKNCKLHLQSWWGFRCPIVSFDAVNLAVHDVLERIGTWWTLLLRSPLSSIRASIFTQRCGQHQSKFCT